MYTIIKRFEIAASHRLKLEYESPCGNLHGHNWIVEVTCQHDTLNASGMVIDFAHIKKAVHEKLDHKNMNDILPCNPTAENIAKWICDSIPYCVKVIVMESENNTAIYEKS